ncbi:MAG: class I SAM-dependent methyltransferase [Novosphingobium sp.]|nr:class I SAM-dependent methyltransferase [Novosphingobium sp.]
MRGLERTENRSYENGFYWFSETGRIAKLLAHHELYRSIMDLPGDVFELGVYKAASLIRFATFRSLFENDQSRKIVGFDAFGSFPRDGLALDSDLSFIDRFEEAGGDGLTQEEVSILLDDKGFSNIALEAGNVFDTLPSYLARYPATRLALLHLDMDVQEPTAFALELLWDRIVPGGLVVIDDYNAVAGATDAVDEFISARGLKLEKLGHYYVPAFIRKPA